MLYRTLKLSLVLASTAVGVLVTSPVIAQEALSQVQFNPEPGASVGFMPTDRRMPVRTASGGRRGACASAESTVVPLLPRNGGALSATDTPSFWVYVPADVKGTAHFRLTDEHQEDFAYQSITLPEAGGLVKVQLPQDSDPLAAGKTYQWFFSVDCAATEEVGDPFAGLDESERSQETFVTGWVRYQPLTTAQQTELTQQSSLEQAIAFAQLGYWHDSLDRVAQLQQSAASENTRAAWDGLLNSAGLVVQADGSIAVRDELISQR